MKRVLIVDDSVFMLALIRTVLENNGYQIVGQAETGTMAVKLYKELGPDLVTMDITMPDMQGLDALREIIAFDSAAKVIMVSAIQQEQMIVLAENNGAKGFVVKPFLEEQVLRVIENILI